MGNIENLKRTVNIIRFAVVSIIALVCFAIAISNEDQTSAFLVLFMFAVLSGQYLYESLFYGENKE